MHNKYRGFIFDLDGTIYRGEKIIPNADITVNRLKKMGKKVVFISNKTTGSVSDYCRFLVDKGLNINENEIINSTLVIKKHLMAHYSEAKFYAIGEKVFIDELLDAGIIYEEDPDKIDIVIVTLDRTLNYSKLEIAAKALEHGAKFFAANIDDTCPVEDGEILDAGSTISALEKRTHLKLEKHFGKPSEYMMSEILDYLKIDLRYCLLVGDRLETDIAMGNNFGIDTALVNTGVKNYHNGNPNIVPTFKIDSVFDIIKDLVN